MERTRVPKGKLYYYINGEMTVSGCVETDHIIDKYRYNCGNYFKNGQNAQKMAKKLRAVLNGAEVYTEEEMTEIKANAFADGMEAERRKSKIVK